MHSLGIPSTSGTTSKGKQPKKKRKTELEKLAPLPGWENWYPPGHKLRKGLQRDYESDLKKKKSQVVTRKSSKGRVTKTTKKTGSKRRGFDIQKMIAKTGMEFHWPGYQYMGPGTHLEKRLKRGDPGINRLGRVSKQHDIDYSIARNLADKHKADKKMIQSINKFKKKNLTERFVKKVMQTKTMLNL